MRIKVPFMCVLLLSGPARAQEDQPPLPAPPAASTQPSTPAPPAKPPPPRPVTPDKPPPSIDRTDQEDPPGVARRPAAAAGDGAARLAEKDPVVRAAAGNMGMFFRFGGLATLTSSNNTRTVNELLITQIGMKFVISENWMVPVYFGTGLRLVSPEEEVPGAPELEDKVDVGFDLGASFEYHFRIWRRISPFFGVGIGLGLTEPTGDENMTFGVSMGPALGVEYYIGDRVSLTAQYMFLFLVEYQEKRFTSFAFRTMAGGALNLTYYF